MSNTIPYKSMANHLSISNSQFIYISQRAGALLSSTDFSVFRDDKAVNVKTLLFQHSILSMVGVCSAE